MNVDYLKKYPSIIVIGHKNPDTDTIISSYVLANIFKSNGIDAHYGILENEYPNKGCMKIINDVMNYQPVIIKYKDINKYHYFLVDHNDPLQSINDPQLVVGCIDHHLDSGKISKTHFTKYCSTTLAIYDLFKNNYHFNKDEKYALYMGLVDDSSFGLNSRYKDIDKNLVKEMGYDDHVNKYFKKYFIPTNLQDKLKAFASNGRKEYEFGYIKFISTYIEALDNNCQSDYQLFIKNNKNNYLGMWLDYHNLKTYTYLKYNDIYIEKCYNYIAARSTTVLNDTLEILRGINEKN